MICFFLLRSKKAHVVFTWCIKLVAPEHMMPFTRKINTDPNESVCVCASDVYLFCSGGRVNCRQLIKVHREWWSISKEVKTYIQTSNALKIQKQHKRDVNKLPIRFVLLLCVNRCGNTLTVNQFQFNASSKCAHQHSGRVQSFQEFSNIVSLKKLFLLPFFLF